MTAMADGCAKQQLDTPALCVDLDKMDDNIRRMADTCSGRGIQWRPHAKCHKSPVIARRLVAAGAVGVTCAKLGEAEVMAAGGVADLLIANMIVGPAKIQRLVQLRTLADPIVCVDHLDHLRTLAAAMAAAGLRLRVFIEVDIGMARVGVQPGAPAVELARQIERLPSLALAGVMGYEGHLLTVPDPDEKRARIHEALDRVVETQGQIERSGIACPIVSCGGTGSYRYTVEHPGVTELQAGGAIFMDAFYREACQVHDLQFALTVLTTIVSRPAPDRAIIDAGRKTLDRDIHTPRVLGRDDVTVSGLSAEHGSLKLDGAARQLRIGDRLELIPGYGDLTTVLHDEIVATRGDRVEAIWPLEARGKLR